ncbi:uncharacterized protein H6S33_009478 [Morchella sextelata]|uniref:uncharacterized protein n=1 Tax=Morchella sextelata TaxID=1174677 RepID=UPI001D03816A|nr:uncharacterized protein H6S33_009478 [Morchella sextelata]KAH0613098.1 hypothetical protein H6S33_009478 [Morchella sextelata]
MVHFSKLAVALGLVLSVYATPKTYSGEKGDKKLEVQAHRGGLGYRPESTLWAFAKALESGANVLEMDTLFTKDGVPVIWHDHQIVASKCKDTEPNATYVGQFIANLTLAQVQSLDCGSLQLDLHKQVELHPGARIPTLEEVLDLVDCYGDKKVEINLETKIDPIRPNETLALEKYIDDIVPILERRGWAKRTYIQSFDWRTLIGIKEKFPETRIVALLDDTTVIPEDRGVSGYPWLGGINLDGFNGDWVAAAKSIGSAVLSPVHGYPSSQTPNTPGYTPFVTKDVVQRAHKLGMQVVPWTVDYEITIKKLILDGVDGIISNYPDRVFYVGAEYGMEVGIKTNRPHPQCLKNASIKI